MATTCVENKELTAYCKSVEKNLRCPKKVKKSILYSLENDILDFVEKYPEAKTEDIINSFGTPERFAVETLSVMDDEELQKEIRKSKWIKRGILIAVGVIVLLGIFTTVWVIKDNARVAIYYYSDQVTH